MQAPLRGLARVYNISPGAKCVSDFLTVVTKCQAGTREEDLCGFWLEGIPSVMAGEAWWRAVEGHVTGHLSRRRRAGLDVTVSALPSAPRPSS